MKLYATVGEYTMQGVGQPRVGDVGGAEGLLVSRHLALRLSRPGALLR